MSTLEAIILGIIQGATEFLPVSSSGHLVLGGTILGLSEAHMLFDIILHVGTLLSVCLFYRADIAMILKGLFDGIRGAYAQQSALALVAPEGARLAGLVVLATIPTGIIGLLIKDFVDPEAPDAFITPQIVCGLLILNGFILMANAYFQRRAVEDEPERTGALNLWNIAPWVALTIGVAQGIAVLPGLSRSGLTITVALALSVHRLHAARFSFLLSIPAILGAVVLKVDTSLFTEGLGDGRLAVFGLGALTAAAVGYVCLVLLTKVLARAQFHHFAWYCWALGIAGSLYYALGA